MTSGVNVYVTEIVRTVEQRNFVGGKSSDMLSMPTVRCVVLARPAGLPKSILSSSHELLIALSPEEHAKLTVLMAEVSDRITRLLNGNGIE